ncbi:MAG TPA: transposase [Bacteroidales bacterium]|jgi:transposase-like protein|nr:transposase [Bacteroidales bacterium]
MKKSNYEQKVVKKYSSAFKLKVVNEIESGKLSMSQAREIYDIGGAHTIERWIQNLGKNHLLSKVVRIEMKDEKDKVKELNDRVRQLEKLLANKELDNLMNEAFLELLAEDNGIDLEEFKKKVDKERLKKRL